MKGFEPVNLILMGNTLRFENKKNITRVYDLKGSSANRYVDMRNISTTSTLKDLNFLSN